MANRLLSMIVLPVVAAVCLSLNCSDVSAEGFRYTNGYSYPYDVPAYGNRFGGGSIYSYVYNPYAGGNFKAPDLLNDPLFQAQHKFDSQFLGRYKQKPQLVQQGPQRPQNPKPSSRPNGGFLRALFKR